MVHIVYSPLNNVFIIPNVVVVIYNI